MDEKLMFFYDKEGDILDISIGKPKKAVSKEIENDIILRLEPKTRELVGFTILNFEKRFKKEDKEFPIPITAEMREIA